MSDARHGFDTGSAAAGLAGALRSSAVTSGEFCGHAVVPNRPRPTSVKKWAWNIDAGRSPWSIPKHPAPWRLHESAVSECREKRIARAGILRFIIGAKW